jgi:glycosyltransferase involved in cell wall biosynthesis
VLEAVTVAAKLLFALVREARREPDSIVYSPTTELWWTCLPAYIVQRFLGVRVVMVPLNTVGRDLLSRLRWRAHKRADAVIAISESIRAELSLLNVVDNVEINGCGFDPPELGPPKVDGIHPNGIYVGRVEKGLNDHLLTWHSVIGRVPDAKLAMVGYASPRIYREWHRRRGHLALNNSVHMAGVVSEEQKWQMLGLSRVFLFLSRVEGWGIAPLEALWAGLPVVVYDLPCYTESLAGLKGVYRIAVGDFEGAASVVTQLLTMPRGDFYTLSASIRNAFRSPSWRQVADREFAVMQAVDGRTPSARLA